MSTFNAYILHKEMNILGERARPRTAARSPWEKRTNKRRSILNKKLNIIVHLVFLFCVVYGIVFSALVGGIGRDLQMVVVWYPIFFYS